jgi:lipoyl(octanoyl) transferase
LHDQEVTYSITCSCADLGLPVKVKESYKRLCQFLKTFYLRLGLEAFFANEVSFAGLGAYGKYCFYSFEEYDLLVRGKKLGGNAQRRRKEVIFQHGSIPQGIDFAMTAGIFKGSDGLHDRAAALDTLLGRKTEFSQLSELLCSSFQETFRPPCAAGCLSEEESILRDELLEKKYLKSSWNDSRQAPQICPIKR